jgi:hypothetical protein
VPGDPKVSFYLARTDVWRGARAAAPVSEQRFGVPGSDQVLRGRPDGEVWLMLLVDPRVRDRLPAIDRADLLRTYFGTGAPAGELAALILAGTAPGATADQPPATAEQPIADAPARDGGASSAGLPRTATPQGEAGAGGLSTERLRVMVPAAASRPLAAMGERVQALLIRDGALCTLERGDPRIGAADGRVALIAVRPRTGDPRLRLWDLLDVAGWAAPETLPALRQLVSAHADRIDRELLAATARRIEQTLGLVPIGRVPVALWLRPDVETAGDDWHWPWLWVAGDQAQVIP